MPRAAFGTQWFNPMYISKPKGDTLLRELSAIELRLEMPIAQPANMVGTGNVPMEPEEYARYQQLAGARWREFATALLPTLQSPAISDQKKRDLITLKVQQARTIALAELKSQSPDLIEAMTNRKLDLGLEMHAPRKATRESLTNRGNGLSLVP